MVKIVEGQEFHDVVMDLATFFSAQTADLKRMQSFAGLSKNHTVCVLFQAVLIQRSTVLINLLEKFLLRCMLLDNYDRL